MPAQQDIAAIIALDGDPALRNLRITQCYHDLSQSIASVIGATNVNWCTFASWASKTAGRFVRGELLGIFRDALQSDRRLADKLDRLNQLLRRIDAAAGLSQWDIFGVLKAPVTEVSRYIMAGNLAFSRNSALCFVPCANTWAGTRLMTRAPSRIFSMSLN